MNVSDKNQHAPGYPALSLLSKAQVAAIMAVTCSGIAGCKKVQIEEIPPTGGIVAEEPIRTAGVPLPPAESIGRSEGSSNTPPARNEADTGREH